ncbi:HD domain-containing phosphohydrolase [Treponema brennaborense]|uniref:Response regulator receiver modulated metal dependent phosphohydrolase n=1 Tax=Treponema brennaborense (strain DSM 12168 / CIP 105900 / DD5/3) TaxID=906968 RepID=F4LJG0_TREBD|nr:HD domain-containing phosphohydrolase [Treponema brennaborense]AEE16355.1 response regulator receiver modulated metal dependent phosphohydrolase [Treponema brennaborense DSM 12168]
MTEIPFKILCADDSTSIRQYLTGLLTSWNYDVTACASGTEALEAYRTYSEYSVVLLDWIMPGMTGIDVCRQIRAADKQGYTYIIMLTSKDSTENIVEALNAGADDYLIKPFHPAELQARIQTAFRIYQYEQKLKRTEYETRLSCYRALTELAEARDYETGQHLQRVSGMAKLIAKQLGTDGTYQNQLAVFAPMHDIGKVGIPDGILHLPRKLTSAEFEVIKTHTTIGYQILCGKKTMEMAAEIAYSHHEKWNGLGYPRGLQKEEIPLSCRIVSIVDIYDALRSIRPYKQAYSHQDSVEWLYGESGKSFDPDVVEAFRAVEPEMKKLFEISYQTFPAQP